jgi:hypothetical protein
VTHPDTQAFNNLFFPSNPLSPHTQALYNNMASIPNEGSIYMMFLLPSGVAGGAAHFFSGGANNVEFTTAEETTEATGGALVSRYNGNLKCQCDLLFCNPNPTDNHFASAVELQVDKESSTIVGNKEVPTNVKRFKCKKCAYGQ